MPKVIDPIDIQVTSRLVLDERLEAAVNDLREVAMLTRTHGILITRNRPGHYTVALSEEVPFGTTRELIR